MEERTDLQLIALATGGDRQAYGHIVERYQNLVCSLTYSACGDFSQSEDLAQETFVTAWRKISTLKDPARFKSWLCGIARNLAASHFRRGKRKGERHTVPLDSAAEPASTVSMPGDEAISREEEGLIWQTLEGIPEAYRAPLVLFYRQDQSVNDVAAALELSPEAARQRLSRGRAMVKEKVAALVERTLAGSRPGKAFTIATLAALPALATDAAAAGLALSAAKGAMVVKSAATLSLWGALLGPLLGLLGGYFGARASIESARSPRERRFLVGLTWVTFSATLLFVCCLLLLIFFGTQIRLENPTLYGSLLLGLIAVHVAGLTGGVVWGNNRLKKIHEEEMDRGGLYPTRTPEAAPAACREFKTRATFFGLPLVHVAFGGIRDGKVRRGKACGWIAIGDISFGVLLSVGGIAVGGISFGGLACGVVALAGLAGGVLAVGGCAFGWMAAGGVVVAWHAALGGLAIAVNYAMGGLALAAEANSDATRELFTDNPILAGTKFLLDHSRWFMILLILPVFTVWNNRKKSGIHREKDGPDRMDDVGG
jgi:RNA polymerase sigma factor (sigma-70 family)